MPAPSRCIEPFCSRKAQPKCRRCSVHQPYFVGWKHARKLRNQSKPHYSYASDGPTDETGGREEIHSARGRSLAALFRGR